MICNIYWNYLTFIYYLFFIPYHWNSMLVGVPLIFIYNLSGISLISRYEAGLLFAFLAFIPFCEAGVMDGLSLQVSSVFFFNFKLCSSLWHFFLFTDFFVFICRGFLKVLSSLTLVLQGSKLFRTVNSYFHYRGVSFCLTNRCIKNTEEPFPTFRPFHMLFYLSKVLNHIHGFPKMGLYLIISHKYA